MKASEAVPYYIFQLIRELPPDGCVIQPMLIVQGKENVPKEASRARKIYPGDIAYTTDRGRMRAIFDPRDLAGTSEMTNYGYRTAGLRYQRVSGLSAFIWRLKHPFFPS